ncbi:MAG: DUF3159 domain-containing protein [Streptosporangiales bacterium]|nr:DUF3159 domain-containing protein [Streptosporangiales bacterium]
MTGPDQPGESRTEPTATTAEDAEPAEATPTPEEQRKSLLGAVGGGRGALETSVPGLLFVTIFSIWRDVQLSAIVAVALALVFLAIRVGRRSTVQYAVGGFVGVLIAGLFAVSTGEAKDYFVPSMLKNLGFAALYLVSVLVRWPLLGVIIGPLLKENFAWRAVDARRRAYAQATLLWAAMFAVRLAVIFPLYHLDMTFALGVAGVALGWPVFAVVAWVTWLIIRRVPPVRPDAPPGTR